MKFPQDFIDRVMSSTNLVDIISQYTQLKPQGRDLVGRCPFPDHKEKTPSFHVSPDKQVYHCFGCKKGGNVLSFLKDHNGMSFRDAIEFLADRARIPIPEMRQVDQGLEKKKADKKKTLQEINRLAAQYFVENLKRMSANHSVWQYIKKRELGDEIIHKFHLGYASEEWDGLTLFLQKKGVPLHLAAEVGLVKERTGGKEGYYDIFRHRLMFIIFSPMGDPIGFGGRVLDDSLPKYINSPETALYHKGKTLYGLSETARFIRSEDQAILVEGYMDLIALYQAGICNVAAPLGTALTEDQCRVLVRISKNIFVLFDGDQAGQAAAERSLPILLAAGSYPRGLVLTEAKDPDEYLKLKGAESLKGEIAKAKELFFLVLDRWMEGYKGEPSEKVKLADRLRPVFVAIQDKRLYSLYIRETANRMRVEPRWLQQALQDGAQGQFRKPVSSQSGGQVEAAAQAALAKEEEEPKIKIKGAPTAELNLLGAIVYSEGALQKILHAQIKPEFTHQGIRQVIEKAEELTRQQGFKFDSLVSLLTSYVESPEILTAAWKKYQDASPEDGEKLLEDSLRHVRMSYLDRVAKELANDIKSNSSPEKLAKLMNIQKEKMSLLKTN